jgi:hypothetical protein
MWQGEESHEVLAEANAGDFATAEAIAALNTTHSTMTLARLRRTAREYDGIPH